MTSPNLPFARTRSLSLLSLLSLASTTLAGCATLPGLGDKSSSSSSATTERRLRPGQPGYVSPGPIAGPLHQKYAGKIVFSSAPIPDDGSDDSTVYQTYKLGQPLYVRAWAAESPNNLLPGCGKARAILRADVNGKGAAARPGTLDAFGRFAIPTDAMSTHWMRSLSGSVDRPFHASAGLASHDTTDAGSAAVRDFNAEVVSALAEGKNAVRVVVTLDCSAYGGGDTILAEGALDVEVPPGGLQAYFAANKTEVAASPHKDNAKLVPQIVGVMKKHKDWSNEEILGARVTSEDWLPIRHELTKRVIAMQVDALVVVRARNEASAEKCRSFDMAFRRDPAGGPLKFAGTGNMRPIPCASAPR